LRDVISASSEPDANGVVELSPFDVLYRLPDLALVLVDLEGRGA
jgi:hypothetical protein